MSVPPPVPALARPSWWSRHWKWCVPVLVAAALAIFAGFMALLVNFVFGLMKSSEPYQTAMARARADAGVAAALGRPIEAGFFVQGNVSTGGGQGEANLAIPLQGRHGKATLYVEARQSAGDWRYDTLLVKVEGGNQRFDLREAESSGTSPAP